MIRRQCSRTPSMASRIASRSRMNHTFPGIIPASKRQQELVELLGQPEAAGSIVHGRSFLPAYYHPREHNIPVALIHFRSYHVPLLNLFMHFASHAASALAIPISKPIPLPTQRSLWTVPRSPFVHKQAQENFERRTHKRAIKAWDADDEVIDRWVKYMEAHVLAGVGMRVVRWQRAPVSVGTLTMDAVKNKFLLEMEAKTRSSEKVKALGEKIIEQELAAAASASADPTSQTIVQSS
ncbi:unnamed protein product [Somion occarium]